MLPRVFKTGAATSLASSFFILLVCVCVCITYSLFNSIIFSGLGMCVPRFL